MVNGEIETEAQAEERISDAEITISDFNRVREEREVEITEAENTGSASILKEE